MAKRAIPKTHLIRSLINHELPERHVTALCEFVDNSLGEGAGDANEVIIHWDSKRVVISDDGQGVARLQALFTLGDSASRLHSGDIGQFGFGAKVGALYLAWHMTVRTVHQGRLHKHEVDWADVLNSEKWPLEYDGNGSPAAANDRGTRITLTRRHKGRVWQGDPLAHFLAHIYRPALLSGKKINLQQRSGRHLREWNLSRYLGTLTLTDKFRVRGSVDGKDFVLRAGIGRNLTPRLNGIHIAFGHRFIKTETRLIERHIPAGLYAEVMLSDSWKTALSSNKSSLAHSRDELLAEVERLLKSLLDQCENEALEVEIKSISVALQSRAQEAINSLSDEPGEVGEGPDDTLVEQGSGSGGGGGEPPDQRPEAQGKGLSEPQPAANRRTGISVSFVPNMGERVSKVDVSRFDVRVSLNRDLLIIKGSRDNIHSLLVTVFNAVLDECITDEGAHYLFPNFARDIANGEAPFNAKQRTLYKLLGEHQRTMH